MMGWKVWKGHGRYGKVCPNGMVECLWKGRNDLMEGEEEGFMGAMWNGVFYGSRTKKLLISSTMLADPTGGQNGGMGAGGGGGGGGGGGLPGLWRGSKR